MKQQKRALKPYNYEKTAAFFQTAVHRLFSSERQRAIENPLCDLRFAHHRQSLLPVFRDERHDIGVHVKSRAGARHVVGHDHIEILARQLVPRVHQNVVGFRRKADKNLPAPLSPQAR